MGKLGLRLAFDLADNGHSYEIVHINEPDGDPTCHAHLLEFDSVHGRWNRDVEVAEDALIMGENIITFSAETGPTETPWSDTVLT